VAVTQSRHSGKIAARSTTPPAKGFAQRNGNGTQEAQVRAQKAQKVSAKRAFLVLFVL
jgi:hypothetical protein